MGLTGLPTKKIWGLEAPPSMRPETPNLFWEVQEVPIGPPEKINWLVQFFHGCFLATLD